MINIVINLESPGLPEDAELLTSQGNALLHFLSSLGYAADHLPLADLLRRYHKLQGDWLVVSPVHWQATHNDALMVALGKQEVLFQESDTRLWFNLFADYLKQEGMTLYYHNPETWLISGYPEQSINAKTVYQLMNKSLMPELAKLDKTLYWQKFITESQMFFASRPNQSSINGIWVWGAGTLADKKPIAVCTDEYFLPMAKICSTDVSLYHPAAQLKKYSILLLSDLSVLSKPHQEKLTKSGAHWYWNNLAYTQNHSHWFTRLWRRSINAD